MPHANVYSPLTIYVDLVDLLSKIIGMLTKQIFHEVYSQNLKKYNLMFVCFQARNWDENGNPPSTSTNNSSGSSVSFTARQLKPLSIYRHNPAFHSQHVSVNQCDEIPPLSPTALQPNNSLNSTTEGQENSDRMLPAKVRRKKKVSKFRLYNFHLDLYPFLGSSSIWTRRIFYFE